MMLSILRQVLGQGIGVFKMSLFTYFRERGFHTQNTATMSEKEEVVATKAYFRVDYRDRLPESEVQRRLSIQERLETQYKQWQTYEQHSRH